MRSTDNWASARSTVDRIAAWSWLSVLCLLQACTLGTASETVSAGGELPRLPRLEGNFEQWQRDVRAHVAERSMAQRSLRDIELNLPFEKLASPAVPYQGRFLLLHGLNDSAYVWRDLAEELVARGYDVRAILFDGHGTTPVDMLDVHWETWLEASRRHLEAWSGDGVPVSLGGFSMGAVLATLLALDNPDIASLLLISPAFDSRLNHLLRFSGVYKLFRPWVFGGMILEDNPMKYNSIPVNSGYQFYELTRALKRRWSRNTTVNIPTLMVFSLDDSVVDVQYTLTLFRRRFSHPRRQLLVYQPSRTRQGEADRPVDPWPRLTEDSRVNEATEDSYAPEHRILNQSHLGIMYAPTNPLFGQNGRVLVCNGNEYPIFIACMRSSQHWYGAQHTPSPDGVAVARTTWNPLWPSLLSSFDRVHQLTTGGPSTDQQWTDH